MTIMIAHLNLNVTLDMNRNAEMKEGLVPRVNPTMVILMITRTS
jgi:hypothetical protein